MMKIFGVNVWLLLWLPLVCSQPQGWLNSTGYPLAYPNKSTMNWTRCASPGFAVSLNLIHLDLENSTNCEHDALMIFSGKDLIKSLCGSLSFMEINSIINPYLHSASGGCLSIYFHSDDSFPQIHTGFNALHQIQDVDECASQNNSCSHFCSNFIGGFSCRCPHGYLLNPNNHTCDVIKCGQPKPLVNGHLKYVKGSENGYLSVIAYHCNAPFYISKEKQNGNFTCGASQIWRETGNNILPSCHYVCGQHTLKSHFSRILGGKPAPNGSFPWQVHLLNSQQRGGAIIIGEKWLMTAAHNVVEYATTILSPKEKIKVYAGHNNLTQMRKYTALQISSVHVHENYNTDYDNDIALIKLESPITFSNNIRPVCLPPKHFELNEAQGFVSGYGITESRGASNKLMFVDIYTVTQNKCRSSYNDIRKKSSDTPPVTDNMFCAGFVGGGKDSCTGDSGSAFVVQENGVYCAAGIVSWGPGHCGKNGTYGVYTYVSRYLDWINKKMSENK